MKKKQKSLLVVLIQSSFLFLLIFSCTEKKEALKYIDGDDLIPPSPPFYMYFTMLGADVDGDGVRDDVELWINENGKNANIRRALKALAFSYQEVMKYGDDREKYLKISDDIYVIDECITFLADTEFAHRGLNLSNKMGGIFINSPWKKWYYRRGEKFFASGSYRIPETWLYEGGVACPFKIESIWEIIEAYKIKYPKLKFGEEERLKVKDMYEDNPQNYDPYKIFKVQYRGVGKLLVK